MSKYKFGRFPFDVRARARKKILNSNETICSSEERIPLDADAAWIEMHTLMWLNDIKRCRIIKKWKKRRNEMTSCFMGRNKSHAGNGSVAVSFGRMDDVLCILF